MQRIDIAKQFRQAPSLKAANAEEFADAYKAARLQASRATRLRVATFPVEPPFTSEQALDDDFWPEPPSSD